MYISIIYFAYEAFASHLCTFLKRGMFEGKLLIKKNRCWKKEIWPETRNQKKENYPKKTKKKKMVRNRNQKRKTGQSQKLDSKKKLDSENFTRF